VTVLWFLARSRLLKLVKGRSIVLRFLLRSVLVLVLMVLQGLTCYVFLGQPLVEFLSAVYKITA
jgi:hypothetical protein